MFFSRQADQQDPGSSGLDWRTNQWRIGQSGIERSNILIVGVVEVAAGSWMPILQLTRYIF
jgi:hypothetical protein